MKFESAGSRINRVQFEIESSACVVNETRGGSTNKFVKCYVQLSSLKEPFLNN